MDESTKPFFRTEATILWKLIYLATEVLSDSFECIGAIKISLSINLSISLLYSVLKVTLIISKTRELPTRTFVPGSAIWNFAISHQPLQALSSWFNQPPSPVYHPEHPFLWIMGMISGVIWILQAYHPCDKWASCRTGLCKKTRKINRK